MIGEAVLPAFDGSYFWAVPIMFSLVYTIVFSINFYGLNKKNWDASTWFGFWIAFSFAAFTAIFVMGGSVSGQVQLENQIATQLLTEHGYAILDPEPLRVQDMGGTINVMKDSQQQTLGYVVQDSTFKIWEVN